MIGNLSGRIAATAFVIASGAAAQAMDGNFAALLGADSTTGWVGVSGQIAGAFGGPLGGQLDVYAVNAGGQSQVGATGHLTYALGGSSAAGLFYNVENYQGEIWYAVGVEARTMAGPVALAASYSLESTSPGSFVGTDSYGRISGTYDFGNGFSVELADSLYYGALNYPSLTLSRDLANGMTLSGTAMSREGEGVFSLQVRTRVGQGATFARPDYTALFGFW
jgi:hypothetical protein